MKNELNIIKSNLLKDISDNDINEVIAVTIEKTKKNDDEINKLILECTSLLVSAENREDILENQGTFKRLIGEATGKNHRVRNAILKDENNALYAAQKMISCLAQECRDNQELMLAIHENACKMCFDITADQKLISNKLIETRKDLLAFLEQYIEESDEHKRQIDAIQKFVAERCPKCGTSLHTYQHVCPSCGYMHDLKKDLLQDDIEYKINKIAEIVSTEPLSKEIIWDATAQKIDRVLRKVKRLAEIGEFIDYTEDIEKDIYKLMTKCKSSEFQIAIVGVMKAGKSYLMNALMGAEIASVEVNPETAALTKFKSTDGYYVKVRFHSENEWNALKESVEKNHLSSKRSLGALLIDPSVIAMENDWINHEELVIECEDLGELKKTVQLYTSSRTKEHLFVSEVEVGVDRNLFNMPQEVVFVDTPGLQDPVEYRSNITKEYIKKADAVLIAVPTAALTTEGNEIITTVLDCVATKKAYIVATQRDTKNDDECEKIISLWVDQLVEAKRYPNERVARSKIIPISAKIELLLNKWLQLNEEERNQLDMFSDEDFYVLEAFTKRVIKTRMYSLNDLDGDKKTCDEIRLASGIDMLRGRLEANLISQYRQLKLENIKEEYLLCKKQISRICKNDIRKREEDIYLAEKGSEAIKTKIEELKMSQALMQHEHNEIKTAANTLKYSILSDMRTFGRKEVK